MTAPGVNRKVHDSPDTPAEAVLTVWHQQLLHYLQTERTALWQWFSGVRYRAEAAAARRLELLKTAYRLDRTSAAVLYLQCDAILGRMHLDVPVTLYHAQQHATGLNASLPWLPGEAHIVFSGPVLETLTDEEVECVLAHELAHFELLSLQQGAYGIVDEILSATVSDPSVDVAHERTWRNFRLYTEVYCDRRALQVTENLDACVRALVKMDTGLKRVSAAAYRQQAGEILAADSGGSDQVTHPEMYLRARALELWADSPQDCDQLVAMMVEGPLQLQLLDLLQQHELMQVTISFLQHFLKRAWLRTPVVLGYARQICSNFEVTEPVQSLSTVCSVIDQCDVELRRYFCCLLLDLATIDPDLDEAALAAAFLLAGMVGLTDEFRALAAEELAIGKRSLQRVETSAEDIVQQAATESAG